MLYDTPTLTPEIRAKLADLDELRHRLGRQVRGAGLWLGTLRRLVQATSVESSTSIEGFHVSTEAAVAIISRKETPGLDDENRLAVAC